MILNPSSMLYLLFNILQIIIKSTYTPREDTESFSWFELILFSAFYPSFAFLLVSLCVFEIEANPIWGDSRYPISRSSLMVVDADHGWWNLICGCRYWVKFFTLNLFPWSIFLEILSFHKKFWAGRNF